MRLQLMTTARIRYCTLAHSRPRYRTRRPSCQRADSLSFLSMAGCSLRNCLYSSLVAGEGAKCVVKFGLGISQSGCQAGLTKLASEPEGAERHSGMIPNTVGA
jgi:hypothetical protein